MTLAGSPLLSKHADGVLIPLPRGRTAAPPILWLFMRVVRVETARESGEHPDQAVARLARRQYGVFSKSQLAALGLTRGQVDHRIRVGRFVRLYRGVYAVGHDALTPEGWRMAAVLACPAGAVLSHRSAAAHWGIRPSAQARAEISVPANRARGARGVDLRRVVLRPEDVTVHDGIPITAVGRTIVDLAAVVEERAVGRAIDRAIELGLFDLAELDGQMRSGKSGSARVRRVLGNRHPDSHRTRSEFERRALGLFKRHGLPRPEVNVWFADLKCEVDLLWRDQRLVVELDGWAFHRSRDAFEADRRRLVQLQAIGFSVLPFTWRQLKDEPEWVVNQIGAELRKGGADHYADLTQSAGHR